MSEERIPTGTICFDLSSDRNNLTILDQGNKISIVTWQQNILWQGMWFVLLAWMLLLLQPSVVVLTVCHWPERIEKRWKTFSVRMCILMVGLSAGGMSCTGVQGLLLMLCDNSAGVPGSLVARSHRPSHLGVGKTQPESF